MMGILETPDFGEAFINRSGGTICHHRPCTGRIVLIIIQRLKNNLLCELYLPG